LTHITTLRLPRRILLLELATLLAMLVLLLSPAAQLEDGAGLQFLYSLRGIRSAPLDVVIVALDSTSARNLGQPERPDRWSRRLHARLVADLAARGAAAIGFDMLFQNARDPGDDEAFAAAIRRAGNVVLAERLNRDLLSAADGSHVASINQLTQPLPLLRDAAWTSAPFIMPKTPDGVFEFWSVVADVGDKISLPARMAERMRNSGQASAGQLAEHLNPGRLTLNLYGPLGTVKTIHYSDALALAADPVAGAAAFAGKAVLIGYSDFNQSRQEDVFRTAFSSADGLDISGVELCATALANLLNQSFLSRPPEILVVILLPLWAALLALPWGFARPRTAFVWNLALAGVYGASAFAAFAVANFWLPVILPLGFAPLLAAGIGLTFQYGKVRRRQVELEKAIDLGLTRQGLERLSSLLHDHVAGRTVFAACLCSDIESYTTISESMKPEATGDLLNRYFARFVPIIEDHSGYVTEIVGDSIISLWLAEDSPQEACSKATAAAAALDRAMNMASSEAALKTRIGLHFGPVFIGEVGSEQRREIRAVGDIVNTTSRIQSANKYFGTRLLASAEIANAAPTPEWRCLGRFVLTGKAQSIELHAMSNGQLSATASAAFDAGREAFRGGELVIAEQYFMRLLELFPDDGPGRFYLQQCRQAPSSSALDADGAIVLPGK
jgi:adenylate cyclase